MKDRIPANPGRVLITPENGGAPYYATVTRADNPTQPGDPLNKNTLWRDATAALFGLSKDSVPDDGFQTLAGLLGLRRFDKNLANEYLFALGAGSISVGAQEVKNIGIDGGVYAYGDSVSIVGGAVVIDNEAELQAWEYGGSAEQNQTLFNLLKDKYFRVSNSGDTPNTVYRFYSATSSDTYTMSATVAVMSVEAGYTYYNSPDPNAYPESEGYINLGRVGEGARIATGTYTGTGTNGASNPNSLTFDFAPKAVWIVPNGEASYGGAFFLSSKLTTAYQSRGYWVEGFVNGSTENYAKLNGTTLSWYNSKSGGHTLQHNTSGSTYYYIAIG